MGKNCCIEGCEVSDPDVEYFKFPRSGALLAAWAEATGAGGGAVCGAHFTPDDYRSTRGQRRLLGTAVPSVFHTKKLAPNIENGEVASTDVSKETVKNTTKETVKNVKAKAKNKKAKEKKIIEKSTPETTTDNKIGDTTDNKDVADKQEETVDKNEIDATDKNEIDATDKIEIDPTDKIEIDAIDKNKIDASDKTTDDTTNKGKIENRESSQVDTRQAGVSKENGKDEKMEESSQPEVNDIEDMITNYQIKQTKTLADRLNPEPLEDLIPAILAQDQITTPAQDSQAGKLDVNQLANNLADKLDDQLAQIIATAPVFIEVAVEPGETRSESPQDCLMLLESVQCDIDPSSLMLPEHGPDTDSDMEILDDIKKEDPNPISLLTSSDEDEVIIEEPHIDTVEVSDETDEDDRPLQTLIRAAKPKPPKPPKPVKPKKKGNYEWGYEFYCLQCDYRTNCEAEFKQHNLELSHHNSTTIQVCPTCNYTTASKAQFSRHKRKHRDERNFKCHLCNYKARHNMSLIYHLKCHAPVEKKREKFTCEKCGFSSNVKSEALNHLKLKACERSRYSCDQCSYSTKRRSDLRRHRMRRHSVDDSDEEYTA